VGYVNDLELAKANRGYLRFRYKTPMKLRFDARKMRNEENVGANYLHLLVLLAFVCVFWRESCVGFKNEFRLYNKIFSSIFFHSLMRLEMHIWYRNAAETSSCAGWSVKCIQVKFNGERCSMKTSKKRKTIFYYHSSCYIMFSWDSISFFWESFICRIFFDRIIRSSSSFCWLSLEV
jgi:hypothetical protein